MIVRPATTEDVADIGALWLQLVQYHQALDKKMPHPVSDGRERYMQRILYQLDDPYAQTFVADHEGEVVGYVMGFMIDVLPEMFVQEQAGFLADIFVSPTWRGQGVGKALVKALREWFAGRGAAYFEWDVAAINREGIVFWRSMGGHDMMIRMRAPIVLNLSTPPKETLS